MTETPQAQETVLVVEDDVLVRMAISQYLRDCGYKVIEAANADEAMTVLSHQEPVIDIVFTDIEMPGTRDGSGLARWVREHRPCVAVILAGTLPRTVEQAKELCDEGPIPKPYDAQLVHNRNLPRGKEQCDQIEGCLARKYAARRDRLDSRELRSTEQLRYFSRCV